MIVCHCRALSDKDFESIEELKQRLLEDDAQCGVCQEELEPTKEKK